MVFWNWFFLFFIFIPMMVAWIYTKFLWLLLILFIPIIGMLIYFIARPDEFLVD